MRIALVILGLLYACSADEKKKCTPGETWMEGCVSCYCDDWGTRACTSMGCPPHEMPHKRSVESPLTTPDGRPVNCTDGSDWAATGINFNYTCTNGLLWKCDDLECIRVETLNGPVIETTTPASEHKILKCTPTSDWVDVFENVTYTCTDGELMACNKHLCFEIETHSVDVEENTR